MSMIQEKIIAVMKDIEAIGKNKKNVTQDFSFRGIDDVYNSLHPLLAKHGVFTIPEVIEDKVEERQTRNGGNLIYRMLKIKYSVMAEDGSFVHGIALGEGMDSGDKAASKAMSIAHKYFLMQLFCIPTEDLIDPDIESHVVAPKASLAIVPKPSLTKTGLQPQHHKALEYTTRKMKELGGKEASEIYAAYVKNFEESKILTEEAIQEALDILSGCYKDLNNKTEV